MKKSGPQIAALCGSILFLVYTTPAQNRQVFPDADSAHSKTTPSNANGPKTAETSENPAVSEMELLRRRVDDVESQNRALMQIVTELKARLEASSKPEDTKVIASSEAAPKISAPTVVETQPQSSQPEANQSARWSDLISEGNKFKLYGFLRLDLDFDSQRPNNSQTPLFITSPDPAGGGARIGEFSMHPRLTRLGIDYTGPRIAKLANAKLSGKLETDFENGGSESRQIIRIRQAFLRLDGDHFSMLAGQTWDIVSPLFPTVNNDTLQWNAGNVGDRRPQLRAAYEPTVGRGKFSFSGGVGLTGAIDALDLDNNGFRDGEESRRPDLQGRIGYAYPVGKDRSASFGISGFYGFLKTARLVAGRTDFHSQLINVDFTLPLASHFGLRGEGWWGRNMSDIRGGAGQGINTVTGQEIRGRGAWSEVNVKVSRYFSFSPGFSTDDPVDRDLPAGGRTRNRAFYFANRITPGGNLLIGADYLRWLTNYNNLRRGLDNRLNIFFQYNF